MYVCVRVSRLLGGKHPLSMANIFEMIQNIPWSATPVSIRQAAYCSELEHGGW